MGIFRKRETSLDELEADFSRSYSSFETWVEDIHTLVGRVRGVEKQLPSSAVEQVEELYAQFQVHLAELNKPVFSYIGQSKALETQLEPVVGYYRQRTQLSELQDGINRLEAQ